MMGIRLDPIWKPDARGVVREVNVPSEVTADLSTDLLLKYALQRRALAFDQTNLIKYEISEQWHQVLLTAYLTEPPPGYKRVTLQQLHAADMELFKELCKATGKGIRMR
eukprot:3662475-Karenia_brevis.AAC.1